MYIHKRFLIFQKKFKILIKSGNHTNSEIGRMERKVAGDKIWQIKDGTTFLHSSL